MKNKVLKLSFMLCIFFSLFAICNISKAANGYTIKAYDVKMVVNEDNTFDITETITTDFTQSKHGIYRKIPTKNTVNRVDGTSSKNRAKITNIKVNEKFSTSTENGYKVIKIGDANKTLTGEHTYVISYTYDIGKDKLKDTDELYYNLIGTEWDTTINYLTFTIQMPKEFDKEKLGFSAGTYGSTNSSSVEYIVDDNRIEGFYTGFLRQGEGLTVRLTLPEGYFVRESGNTDGYVIGVVIVSIIFVIISAILWKIYGRDDKVVETVEFYPPEGVNSAELSFLYNGSVDDKGIISLLIYLANKGYLKIEDLGTKNFLYGNNFRITKLKEYAGNNENERIFFNGLFKRKNSVTNEDLYDRFYTTIDKIKRRINSKENKKKIFEPSSTKNIVWLVLMCIVIFILITVKPVIEYGDPESMIFALLFPGIGFGFALGMILGKTKVFEKIFGLFWGIFFGGVPWALMVLPILIDEPRYFALYAIGLICVAIIIFFIKIMPKRTPYGNEVLGKIKGFKRFLEVAEKEQLEELVSQNPQYFYYILPYTYALGVSDKWVKQFETIAIQEPNWYYSQTVFSVSSFGTFMSSTMKSAQNTMTSSPSSSGGGGSSGGGFSGGGSGGGGGGSW